MRPLGALLLVVLGLAPMLVAPPAYAADGISCEAWGTVRFSAGLDATHRSGDYTLGAAPAACTGVIDGRAVGGSVAVTGAGTYVGTVVAGTFSGYL